MADLIWTRAAAEWDDDEPLLASLDPASWTLWRLPCLATQPCTADLSPSSSMGSSYTGLILTSATAVRVFAATAAGATLLRSGCPAYTHGPKTAALLTRLGAMPRHVDVATAQELMGWLSKNLRPTDRLLWPRAKEAAFDLKAALAPFGIRVDDPVVYQTEPRLTDASGQPPTAAALADWVARWSGVACFASPSAVTGFASALRPATNRLGEALTAVCTGPTTAAAAAQHFAKVITAPRPGVAALLATAQAR